MSGVCKVCATCTKECKQFAQVTVLWCREYVKEVKK